MVWVGQFNIIGGQVQEEGPRTGIFLDRNRGEPDVSHLYILVEPALPDSEEFCPQVIEVIGQLFHESKLSLTGGLLRALRSAHESLREWNRKSLKEHRVATGLSCLAVRDDEAYLAQVGPALAYARQRGRTRLAVPHIPDAQGPLGLYEDFWPAFRRYDLSAGDRLLLVTSNLATAIGAEEVDATLALPPEHCLPKLYQGARQLTDCAALLLAFDSSGQGSP